MAAAPPPTGVEDVGNITAPDVNLPPGPTPHLRTPRPTPPATYPTVSEDEEYPTVAEDVGTPPPPATVDPSTVPDWGEVTKEPQYQNATTDQRKAILDNYTQQMRSAGRYLATQNKEDPARYDKHVDEFYTREKNALDPAYKAFDDTVTTAVESGAKETAKIVAGTAALEKNQLFPEANVSDIKHMSVDEAKEAREEAIQEQGLQEEQATRALNYMRNPFAAKVNPDLDFPGGGPGALDAITKYNLNNQRLDALNSYINSNGANIPNPSEIQKATQRLQEYPQKLADHMQKVDDLYRQDHPKVAALAQTVGAMIPLVGAHVATAAIAGPEAAIAMDVLSNQGDAFQNAVESGNARMDAREKAGEYFSPEQRDRMVLDYATRSAYSVGTFNGLSTLVLGGAAEALHVPVADLNVKGFTDTFKNMLLNPKEAIKYLAQAGVEVGGQAGLQTGAQIASNIAAKESGVSPDQDIYEGVGAAATQGAIFGGTGVALRTAGSLLHWGMDNLRAQRVADGVKAEVERRFNDDDDNNNNNGITRPQILEHVLNEQIPAQFRDSIRARIALDESAKDQAQVSDNLKDADSFATAAEMQKQAVATKNTTVVPTESKGDKLDAEQQADLDALNKRKAEREAKAKKGVVPTEEEGAPTEDTGVTEAEEAAGAPTTKAAAPTKGATTPEDTVNALKAKIDQLMPDATPEEKQKAGYQYLAQINTTREPLQRTAANQLLHETGMIPKATPAKSWSKHTPELMDESAAHLDNYLDQQITAKKEAAVIPPGIFEEAARTNDPTVLLKMLKAGRTLHLSFEESEEYEKFLDDNSHQLGSVYDPKTKTYEVIAKEAKPILPTTTLTFESETPEYEKGTEALPRHPREDEYLKAAQEQIAGNTPLLQKLEDYDDQGQSAAMSRYRRSLREWADAMRKGGFEADMDHPPEYFKDKANTAAINKKTGLKVPSPFSNLEAITHEYGRFKAQLPKQVSLEAPLGKPTEEGEDTAAKQAIEKEASARAEAIKGGTADPIYANVARGAQKFSEELNPEEQAALWHALNKFTQGQIPIPEGTPDASERAIREVFKRFTDWARGHADDPGIKEAIASGDESEQQAGAAHGPPPGEPGLHAGPPTPGVPGGPGHPGPEGGAAVSEPGAGEPGVPATGATAPGKPTELPPAEGGAAAGGGTTAGAAATTPAGAGGATGSERTAGAERPGGASAASRERTGIIQEVPPEPTATTSTPVVTGGGKRTEPTAAAGGGAPGGVTYSALDVAKAMFKKPDIAEDHEIDIEDFKNPQELADHLEEVEEADHKDDAEEWYREMYNDLGIKLPKAKAAPAAAVKPAVKAGVVKLTPPEQRALDNAIATVTTTKAEEFWANQAKMKEMGFNPHEFATFGDFKVRIGDMFRGVTKNKSFEDAMAILQNYSVKPLPKVVTEAATTLTQTTAGAAAKPTEEEAAATAGPLEVVNKRGQLKQVEDELDTLHDKLRTILGKPEHAAEIEDLQQRIQQLDQRQAELEASTEALTPEQKQAVAGEEAARAARAAAPVAPTTLPAGELPEGFWEGNPEGKARFDAMDADDQARYINHWRSSSGIPFTEAQAPPAPTAAVEPPLIVPQGTGPARINNLTMQIARASLEHPETAEARGLDVDEAFGGESYDPTRQIDVQHLADHIDTAMEQYEPAEHLAVLESWADDINKAVAEKSRPAPVETPAVRALEDTQNIANKLATHMVNNPDIAAHYGMSTVTDGASVIARLKQVFPDATPERLNRNITAMAQKLGVIEPPREPGDTHSGGVMYSLRPGVRGTNTPIYADGIVPQLRRAPDPRMQDYAVSLNAHIDDLTGVPIRQLDWAEMPMIFYDKGELWVTPELLRHPDGGLAIGHELQHSIAQEKITNPKSAGDFQTAQDWEQLRNMVRASLPADIRDSLDSRMPRVFTRYDATGKFDYRGLTPREVNWLPIMHALHTGENMLQAVYSNPEFRGYLRGVFGNHGNSALDDVRLWSQSVFGRHGLQFADQVSHLTLNRPGIPARFDPRHFDIKDSYPLTENEVTMQRRVRKYGLGEGVETMVQRVASLSSDPNHKAIANALLGVLAKHPEIKVGLEKRIGGVGGSYNFYGDKVTVNPRYGDHEIEGSILHEVTHALTLGKIRAFESGQIHLLSAADCQAVIDLEDLRVTALDRNNVPQEVRDIASLPNYNDRSRAWMQYGRDHPEEANRFYGLLDTGEFASEAMSNGEFQKHLESIPYQEGTGKPKTMLQKLFSWVRKFLGFSDNTALSNAFDNISTLMGGRRVMEADFEHGGIRGQRTMTMDENMMAKRWLDNKVQQEGYRDAREVPIATLNDWLREFRENMYGSQDLTKPTTIAPPKTRATIPGSDELSNMGDGLDIIDHLSKISGVLARDTESMRDILTRALTDGAITLDQYIEGHKALDGLEGHFVNKLVFTAGKEDDYDSIKNKLGRWSKSLVLPHAGFGTKEMHNEYLKFTNDRVNEGAAQIMRLKRRYAQAVKRDYKVNDPDKLPPNIIEEHNRISEGQPPDPKTPVDTVNALKDLRAYIRNNSRYIVNNEMVSDDVAAKIIKNYPSYWTRKYKIFDDTRWAHRSDSTRYRSAAEAEVNANATPQAKGAAIEQHAKAAGDDAARVFPIGSTEATDAYAKAYDTAKATAKANPAAVMIDKMLDEFEQIARNRQTKGLQYGHAYAIDSTLMEELSPLLNKSPALRNLMGEQHGIMTKFANTAYRQKTFINSVELGRSLAEMGRKNGYIGDRYSPKLSAEIPKQFAHLGPLAGKWTTPEIAQTLTDYSESLRTLDQGPLANVLRTFEGFARGMATVGSPMRTMGNMWTGIFSHLNNGFLNPADPTALKAAGNVIQDLVGRKDAPALNAYMDELHRFGLSDKAGDQRLLMGFIRHGPHIMAREPQDFAEQIFQWAKGAQHKLAPAGDYMVNLHTLGNTMSKASQWEKQQVRERAVDNENVKRLGTTPLTDEEIKAKAAQRVIDTNISYSRATPAIRKMRKGQVVGTFLTFWGEALRSYMHSWAYAVQDTMQMGRPIKNMARRQEGISRLAGLATSATLLPALGAASKSVFGVSNDEDKAFRTLLPPWEQNNVLFYLPTDDEGTRHYVNLSYLSPQGDIGRAMNAAFAPNNDGPIGSGSAAAYEMVRPLFNLGLMPSSIIDAYRNQTSYGTQIYDPEDHWWNKLTDVGQHVLGPVGGGGFGRLFTRVLPGITTPGGRISPSGNVADLWTGLVPELTGLNIRAISIPDRFMSELYSSKDSIDQAQHLFTGPVQRSNNEMTDQQIQDAYQRAEDARRNVFRALSQKVDAARFGGMSTDQIKGALKTRHYSSGIIDDLLTGNYHAYKPSKMVLKNARANGNFIPDSLFSGSSVPEDEE